MSDKTRLQPRPRFYWKSSVLTVRVWTRYSRWFNKYFNGDPWEIVEENFVFVGFSPRLHGWFGIDNFYYDGHTTDSISVFGIVLGKGYSYESRSMKEQDV